MNSKIETYIGFAIRKGSAVFGCDCIARYRKKMYLIVYTPSLSQNSYSALCETAQKLGVEIHQIEESDILSKRNCKALAVCDKSLAQAIINNL